MEILLHETNALLELVLMVFLLGTGLLLTLRLGFIQFRKLGHGVKVVAGHYDDPNAPGDVSHFQALTTALSATVGIGNIAGVAIAIHWGGPGAIFWMWVTAILGMATKFSEVTLAQYFRETNTGRSGEGSVAGGPMYYIEKGLGPKWKPVAMFFAAALIFMGFISGNAIQANTLADLVYTSYGFPRWATGAFAAAIVGLVILGGIERIGKVTGILAPSMAALYVLGGLSVLVLNVEAIWPSLQLIWKEAWNPTAGVAGTGTGVFLQTLLWGVRRGLFSNEAGQGSAPIAHSAAKTDEPVSEGVVALLEPFIDTILICTITALVILTTGVWKETTPTAFPLDARELQFVVEGAEGWQLVESPIGIFVENGYVKSDTLLAWHEVPPVQLFMDESLQKSFSGTVFPKEGHAQTEKEESIPVLYGAAVENAAPLTMWAYEEGLGKWGGWIVLVCVLLFALSTAISWSYYGDRCAFYLFGNRAIMPYRLVYVVMHFLGAVVSLNVIWLIGDLAMALGTLPNVIALIALSGLVVKLSTTYFNKKKH